MATRFNPAPGWPAAPEGWTPPPGWQPDPSWPAAPAGWQWLVDDGQPSQYGSSPPAAPVKKKRRVFMWTFLAIQVLFLIWVIGGASTASGTPDDCGTLDVETCNAASDIGTSIGVGIIIAFWVVVDIILGICYGVYRLASRR